MVDNTRPLGSPSSEYPHKPSDLFGGKILGSTQNQMGTFLDSSKGLSQPSSSIEIRLKRKDAPSVGPEIHSSKPSLEEANLRSLRKELSNRATELIMRTGVVFDFLESSGVGEAYNITETREKIDKRIQKIKDSIKEIYNQNKSEEIAAEIKNLEESVEDIYTTGFSEIDAFKNKERARIEQLQKELEAKSRANTLLTKAMPLYGKFETLTQKVEALTQSEKTKELVKEIENTSTLFNAFKLSPTEEAFETLMAFVNEKEKQITSLFLDEMQQKEKNKVIEAQVKNKEPAVIPTKEVEPTPVKNQTSEAIERMAKELTSEKPTVMRPTAKKTTILLRQKKGENKSIEERTVPVSDWVTEQRRLESAKETDDIKMTRAVLRARGGQMLSIHKKMFQTDPQKYMATYGNKESWVEGDLNKAAFLHAPKEVLDDLANKRSETLNEIATLEAKVMSNGDDGEDKTLAPKIVELRKEEESFAKEMQRYSNLALQEKMNKGEQDAEAKFSSIEQYKEIYKPNAISEKPAPNKPMKRFVNFLMGKDGKRVKEKLPHTEGLIRLGSVEQVEKTSEAQLARNHAVENNPKETVTHKEAFRVEPVLKQEVTPEAVVTQEPVLTPFVNTEKTVTTENQQEKEIRKGKVANLFKKITTGKGLRSFIFAFALGAGIGAGQANQNEQAKTIQTLEQGISFKDYLSPEDKSFLNDFVGSKDSGFEKIMGMYIPSLPLDKANPSRLATLSDTECLKLLNFPGTVYGYSEDQRKEICFVIRRLENIIKARDIKSKMKPELGNSPYTYSNELMTVRGLFEEARRAAEQAINNEATITRKI